MLRGEIRPRLPKLRKEFLIERSAQVADPFRASRARLGPDHALGQLDVMRWPKREVFVVFKERLGKLVFFIQLFWMRKNFDYRTLPLAVMAASFFGVMKTVDGGCVEPAPPQQGKKS